MFVYDIVASVLVFLVALFVIIRSGKLPPSETTGIGPGDWPYFLGWLLLILGAVLLGQTLWKMRSARRKLAEGKPNAEPPPPFTFRSAGMRCIYALCGLFGIFIIVLLKVGFLAGTAVIVPGCMLLLGERRPAVLAAYTAGIPVAVWVIFVRIIGINLP
ncbi:MAG: tripartite tricarboxylate transporter TctB family protein [Planctomycetes bacterium]|nr:tripartite tricarboxylate transporter TctB family protein [Planctomycetota bacterium]